MNIVYRLMYQDFPERPQFCLGYFGLLCARELGIRGFDRGEMAYAYAKEIIKVSNLRVKK